MPTQYSNQLSNDRDTPLRRFATFFLGLACFAIFGLVSAIVYWQTDPVPDVEAIRADNRLEVKTQVAATQAEMMPPEGSIEKIGSEIKAPPAASGVFVPGTEAYQKSLEELSGGGGEGKKLFIAKNCQTCHGDDGDTPIAEIYPKLGGKDAAYILKQMQDINSGARTTSFTPLMKPFISQCSEEEMKILADWLATKK